MPLMTFLPNFLQRRWTAGRPLQTFLVLPHCQANFTAPVQEWKVRCHTETRLCAQTVRIFGDRFHNLLATREIHSFCRNQVGEN